MNRTVPVLFFSTPNTSTFRDTPMAALGQVGGGGGVGGLSGTTTFRRKQQPRDFGVHVSRNLLKLYPTRHSRHGTRPRAAARARSAGSSSSQRPPHRQQPHFIIAQSRHVVPRPQDLQRVRRRSTTLPRAGLCARFTDECSRRHRPNASTVYYRSRSRGSRSRLSH